MDILQQLLCCESGSCICPPTSFIAGAISMLSLIVCCVDLRYPDKPCPCSALLTCLEDIRYILNRLFQVANVLLLVSCFLDLPLLVDLYIWFTLGFILVGLSVALVDLISIVTSETSKGLKRFVAEVAYLFVLSRCLPIINEYRLEILQRIAT